MQRAIVNQIRDPLVCIIRLFMYTLLCVMIGSVYHGLDNNMEISGMHDRAIMHVFVMSCLMALTVAMIPSLHRDNKVFRQEVDGGQYHPIVHGLVYSLSSIPFCTAPHYLSPCTAPNRY
jgi:hypothetical protein